MSLVLLKVSNSASKALDIELLKLGQYGAQSSDQFYVVQTPNVQSYSVSLQLSLPENSLGLLRNTSASASVPQGAFVPIGAVHLNLGVAMRLSTPSRFAEATKLLQRLDLNSLTRELPKPSLIKSSIREIILDVERSMSLSSAPPITQPLSLHLTLSSLVAALLDGQDIVVKSCGAQYYDHTSRVSHLCNGLALIFAVAGLFSVNEPMPLAQQPLCNTLTCILNIIATYLIILVMQENHAVTSTISHNTIQPKLSYYPTDTLHIRTI